MPAGKRRGTDGILFTDHYQLTMAQLYYESGCRHLADGRDAVQQRLDEPARRAHVPRQGRAEFGVPHRFEQVVQADSDLLKRLSQGDGDLLKGCLNEINCPVLLTGRLETKLVVKCCNRPELGKCTVRKFGQSFDSFRGQISVLGLNTLQQRQCMRDVTPDALNDFFNRM